MTDWRKTCEELIEAGGKATARPWFTVDAPWRSNEHPTYAVAGDADPHRGVAVLDSIEVCEWTDEPGDTLDDKIIQADAELSYAVLAANHADRLARMVGKLVDDVWKFSMCHTVKEYGECQECRVEFEKHIDRLWEESAK